MAAGALKREAVEDDICQGRYGQEVQQGYECLTADEKAIFLQAVLHYEEGTMNGRSVYRLTLQRFFPELTSIIRKTMSSWCIFQQ